MEKIGEPGEIGETRELVPAVGESEEARKPEEAGRPDKARGTGESKPTVGGLEEIKGLEKPAAGGLR